MIIITGVAGQGVQLAGDILGDVALEGGLDVRKAATQGTTPREGSVVTQLRIGEDAVGYVSREGESGYYAGL